MSEEYPIRLPRVLRDGDDAGAIDVLQEYFTRKVAKTGYLRTGALWDAWDPSGRREEDVDRLTAEDLVAVTLLSVKVPGQGALILLGEKNAELNKLLVEVGPDRDLASESEELTSDSAAWRLETALWEIHGVGRTIASKLIARKRPRLYPIYDDVVGRELGTKAAHLEPVRFSLHQRNGELHDRLLDLRDRAGLDDVVPAVRILDVLAWMQGKGYKPSAS
ncbi:DUF6308 family protein [Rhodococcus sp. IEGM 1379]|uniref:DUF6308 family protein n=1 Tax=Rhodococcus sp. IEGM 1379 TaxID=3047086 RepID=UPI0024B712FA|nr:DUF6308 family protein [Rhodococcus sp. IEGM 1379]MDI9917810.1 DUF6308 family protein [Rhodococcus sp. IEGM 1379]